MIFHIPHNSTTIPDKIRNQFYLTDKELDKEILLMTDHLTLDLFKSAASDNDVILEFPVSRIVLDPERFLDDQKEVMNKVGMGVVYKKTADGNRLRKNITDLEKQSLIDKYYIPHHDKLNELAENALNEGEVQIIDCHSFPSKPLKYEFNQELNRPDICIGTNNLDKDKMLVEYLKRHIELKGYSVDINKPFSGSILPSKHMDNDRISSIMIEVNRKIYLNEKTGKRSKQYIKTKNLIIDTIRLIRLYNQKISFDTSDNWHNDDAIVREFESFLRTYDYLKFAEKNYSKRDYGLISNYDAFSSLMFSWGEDWEGPFELIEEDHPILVEDLKLGKAFCIEPDRLLRFFNDKFLMEAREYKSFIKGKICLEKNTEERHGVALNHLWENGIMDYVTNRYGEEKIDDIYIELDHSFENEDFYGYHERFVGGFYDSFVSGVYFDLYYECSKLKKDFRMLKKAIDSMILKIK